MSSSISETQITGQEQMDKTQADLRQKHKVAGVRATRIIEAFKQLDPENPNGPRIIVIDDDPDALGVLDTTIGSFGYPFETPGNETRIELVNQLTNKENTLVKADLIILDLNMPGINGKEIAERIEEVNKINFVKYDDRKNRKLRIGTQIIFYTAQGEGEIVAIFDGKPLEKLGNGTYKIDGHVLVRKGPSPLIVANAVNDALEKALIARGVELPDQALV